MSINAIARISEQSKPLFKSKIQLTFEGKCVGLTQANQTASLAGCHSKHNHINMFFFPDNNPLSLFSPDILGLPG